MQTIQTKPQAHVELQLEKIIFTRTDGTTTTIDLLEDVLDKHDAQAAIAWVTLMKLQELSEYAQIQAEQLQALLKVATIRPEMPSPTEAVAQALGAIGLTPDDIATAMKKATQSAAGANGVTISRPNGQG